MRQAGQVCFSGLNFANLDDLGSQRGGNLDGLRDGGRHWTRVMRLEYLSAIHGVSLAQRKPWANQVDVGSPPRRYLPDVEVFSDDAQNFFENIAIRTVGELIAMPESRLRRLTRVAGLVEHIKEVLGRGGLHHRP